MICHKRRAALGVAVAGSLILAACSSSKSGSSATTASGSATTATTSSGSASNTASAPGVSATTIKIGLITALTGVTSSNEADTPQGALARIDAQNAAGGVDGRQIQLVTVDDTSTTAGDLTAAQTLVQEKDVFGIIGYSSFLFASTKYLQQQGIPVTGDAFDGPEWGMQPYNNMFSANPPASTPYNGYYYTWDSDGKFFKQVGVTKLGGFAYGISPSAVNAIKGTFAASAPYGVTECYNNLSVPFGTVDFTADALQLKAAGCNGAVTAFVDSSDLAMATAVRQSGNPVKILNFTGYDSQTLSTAATRAAYDGVYFSNQIFFDKSNPAVATMYANMEKYIPNFNPNVLPDFGLFGGYLDADLMIRGLQAAGQNPTRQSFITNLRQVTGYTAGGLLPSPTPFSPFGTVDMLPQTYCTYFIQLQGSNFVSVGPGGGPICGSRVAYKGVGS